MQTSPVRDLKHRIGLCLHDLPIYNVGFWQDIKQRRKTCSPAVAMPLILCVILEDFTIEEMPVEENKHAIIQQLIFHQSDFMTDTYGWRLQNLHTSSTKGFPNQLRILFIYFIYSFPSSELFFFFTSK